MFTDVSQQTATLLQFTNRITPNLIIHNHKLFPQHSLLFILHSSPQTVIDITNLQNSNMTHTEIEQKSNKMAPKASDDFFGLTLGQARLLLLGVLFMDGTGKVSPSHNLSQYWRPD